MTTNDMMFWFNRKSIYTLDEAIEYQKYADRNFPTGESIDWVNARTGEPVVIGYND